jgi:hypothetical protein
VEYQRIGKNYVFNPDELKAIKKASWIHWEHEMTKIIKIRLSEELL